MSAVNSSAESTSADSEKKLLSEILQLLRQTERPGDLGFEWQRVVLSLLTAERLVVYRVQDEQLVSVCHSGGEESLNLIDLPLDGSSLAGYVALTGEAASVRNAYDPDELAAIDPQLTFDSSFDEATGYLTQSVAAVPLKDKAAETPRVVGVLEVLNSRNGAFDNQSMVYMAAVAQLMVRELSWVAGAVDGPYAELVRRELISAERLEELQQEAGSRGIPVTILLRHEEKLLKDDIGESLAEYYNVPFMPYDESAVPDAALLESLNPSFLAGNNWVPFRLMENQITVLTDDPADANRVIQIEQLLGTSQIDIRVGTREDIHRFLQRPFIEDQEDENANLDSIVDRLDEEVAIEVEDDGIDEAELYDENTSVIIQFVNHIILKAAEMKASDIHIEPGELKEDGVVRVRVDGSCLEVLKVPRSHMRAVIARIKVLSRLDITEKRRPQDGKMSLKRHGEKLELRVAIVPTVKGEGAVMRILASGGDLMHISELKLTDRNLKGIEECLEHPHGIFLCVGPTGSGKTTTLHAILREVNDEETKVLTAEDPVEITQEGLQQMQMQPQIGLTFAHALRTFLRASPDVILVGEMRDYETAHIGTEASLTGHLVFSTLHTNSASETVVRLFDLGLDPMNFADALLGILAQRLVRTLCKECKEPYQASAEEVEQLVRGYGEDKFDELGYDRNNITLYRPKGCETCMQTGYKGRLGIHELLMATPEMKKTVAAKGTVPQIRELATKEGMRTLYQDGIGKILQGYTDMFQLRKVVIG